MSLVDYPGKTAAVVFTQGCNFRCLYCHNKELVIPSCFRPAISQEEVLSFLIKRQGFLGGLVITGGEPTLQKDLLDFLRKVRRLSFAIKLDTNGSRPDVLKTVIEEKLVDFIAMDVKAPLEIYNKLAGVAVDTALIKESIVIIKNSGLDHQFRTTLVRPLLCFEDMPKLSMLVSGAKHYVLQNFRTCENLLEPALSVCGAFEQNEFLNLKEKWEILA